MSPTLKADKPLALEVRRVAAGYVRRAQSVLEQQPQGPHEAIHIARRQFKRLRSLYRLVASADKAFQKTENQRVRTLGQSLSASRDATSLVETARRLAERTNTADEHMALNRIHRRLLERRDAEVGKVATGDIIAAALSACEEALEAIDHFNIDAGPRRAAAILGNGWRETSQSAADALAAAHAVGDPESFHTLRKRAQDRWFHCRFLAEAWPAAMRGTRSQAKQLVTLLGESQDIALLSTFADGHPGEIGPPEDLAHLIAVMISEGDRLRAEALVVADGLFPANAKRDAERIELLWRHAA